jgi:hypothetical protein
VFSTESLLLTACIIPLGLIKRVAPIRFLDFAEALIVLMSPNKKCSLLLQFAPAVIPPARLTVPMPSSPFGLLIPKCPLAAE